MPEWFLRSLTWGMLGRRQDWACLLPHPTQVPSSPWRGAEQEPGTDTQLALVLSVTLSFATSTGHPRLCYQSRKIPAMKE